MMKKIDTIWLVGFLLIPCLINAQITGFVEDFNDNLLTGWEIPLDHQRTYNLTEADSVLKIDYHRTAWSWEWDNFNFTPPLIDISSHPYISVKVKSDTRAMLTLKPVYSTIEVAWLQKRLNDDNEWYTLTFKMDEPGATLIDRIYMYLDGGTTKPAAGIIYFDDLKIGDQAEIVSDLIELGIALRHAWALSNHSVEGAEEGQFAIGSKAVLNEAIHKAQAIFDSQPSTQAIADAAAWDLYDACVTFETGVQVAGIQTIDNLATKETKYLFLNLAKLGETNLLFGMQDATGYGVGWSDDDDRSDVKDVCGSYPAVYGWGIRPVAIGEDTYRLKYRMTSAFERGGINTMEWHQYDPQNRGFYAADVNYEIIVPTLLPGGKYHELYKEKLWRIARYMKALRGATGQSIPVIFRPYHENYGNWFWWGANYCTIAEFITLWQFTVTYLRDSLNVHNLLYAYSPDYFQNKMKYLERYPGDEYVDILGTDQYLSGSIGANDIAELVRKMRDIVELASDRGKVAALTETGRESLDIHDWFTRVLLNPIKNDPIATNIVYAAVWRNANATHHYAPYPGHPSVPDFLKFFEDPYTMFEDDLPDVYALTSLDTVPPYFTQLPEPNFISFDTTITLNVITNERAFVRYSAIDQPYDQMPYEFEKGQGSTRHSTTISGKQEQEHTFYIRAVDHYKNAMDTSAVIAFKIDTLAAPIYWTDRKYNHQSWQTGQAPFGYGSEAVKTTIDNVRTAYFRHEFNVNDAGSITYLAIILRYDNGAVIYLNGKEVGRVNMLYGETSYDTWAVETTSGFKAINFDASAISFLRNGMNVLAVEVHQSSADSSDMLFDLKLINPGLLIDYGSSWQYYDAGKQPEDQKLSVGIDMVSPDLPTEFALYQNYPNPFNPMTTIRYQLANPTRVELAVYDLLGKKVTTLVNKKQEAGKFTTHFDASNFASGVYFYRLRAGDFVQTKKLIVIK